jgi:hypothetical protein
MVTKEKKTKNEMTENEKKLRVISDVISEILERHKNGKTIKINPIKQKYSKKYELSNGPKGFFIY